MESIINLNELTNNLKTCGFFDKRNIFSFFRNEEWKLVPFLRGISVSLSRFLHTLSINLKSVTDEMKDTIHVLKQKRTESDFVF